MRLTIEIGMDNAAFGDEQPELEVVRILKVLAHRLEFEGMPEPRYQILVRDANGSTVGYAGVTP